MRVGYDGITPPALPAGGDIYLAYLDGQWPFYSELATLFPGKIHVPISNHYHPQAQVLDFGEGAATDVTAAIDWCALRRSAGKQPWLYCSASLWASVVKPAFAAARAELPWWWGAEWNGAKVLLDDPRCIGHQYASTPAYDVSVFADYLPGIDLPPPPPKPPAPIPAPAPTTLEEPMYLVNVDPNPDAVGAATGVSLIGGPAGYSHVLDGQSYTALVHAGLTAPDPHYPISWNQHLAWLAATGQTVPTAPASTDTTPGD
jgi:hypothetical protein